LLSSSFKCRKLCRVCFIERIVELWVLNITED
jgi:hypothetical protein